MEDQRIIALYIKRDEQAVAETERTYGGYCHAIARAILGSDADAEEVVADTWLKAWNSIPPQKPDSLKLYLAKLTRNLALTRWRSRSAGKRGGGQVLVALEELSDCVPGDQDVTHALDKKELARTIKTFLAGVKERDRCVFLRRYFYLEDTGQIAQRYGLRESNVLQILCRTRRKLKNYLIQEGYAL